MINYTDKYKVACEKSGVYYASYDNQEKAEKLRAALSRIHGVPFIVYKRREG